MGGKPLTIQDLLKISGLDSSEKIKLVRHADEEKGITFDKVKWNKKKIEEYQKVQAKPVFHNTDYIVVFVGGKNMGTKAVFVGVYEVKSWREIKEEEKIDTNDKYFYELKERTEFNHFSWRVIIEWGKAIQSWYQSFSNLKEIVEIRPPRRLYKTFPGYDEVILTFEELEDIYSNEATYLDWVEPLSAIGGVYVILYKKTGKLYVGSAHGKDGIWGRWREYAEKKHGDNNELKKLLKEDSNAYKDFQFSILKILSKNEKKEIKRWEEL